MFPTRTLRRRETAWHRALRDTLRADIYVLWLLPWKPELDGGRYAPRKWEKWLHAAYYGRVYYWVQGLEIVSYTFEPSLKSVPKKTWYAEGGREMTSGGYTRRLKRWRVPVRGATLNLATDFVPKERLWWQGDGFAVPDAKLFVDRR